MTTRRDIYAALTERAKQSPTLRKALQAYYGRTKTASTSLPDPRQGLHLLNELSRTPSRVQMDERELYADLVQVAFDRPELRTDLLPLLMQMHREE